MQLSDVDGLNNGWLPSGRGCPFENIIGLLTILTIFGLIIVLIVVLYFIVLISDQVDSFSSVSHTLTHYDRHNNSQ